jgi:hypothetical protein
MIYIGKASYVLIKVFPSTGLGALEALRVVRG